LFIRVSHDGGATFDPAFNLGSPVSSPFPQMAVIPAGGGTSDDAVYVVWNNGDSIVFRASNDSGATFGDPITLAGGDTDKPRIEVTGTDVYVIFRSFGSDSPKIFFTMSSDRGATFGPLIEVVDSDVYLNVPKLAASSSTNADSEKTDNIFVTWQEENRGTLAGDVFLRAARFIPLQYNLNLFEGTNPSGQTL